jgi:hypothetical protein
VYNESLLTEAFGQEIHLKLLEIDYNKSTAKYEIEKSLKSIIDYGIIETKKLKSQIRQAINDDKKLPYILIDFYHQYCHGYTFLKELALNYGLLCVSPQIAGKMEATWHDLTSDEQRQILSSFGNKLYDELEKVYGWLKDELIILTGEWNEEMNGYSFTDKRSIPMN